MNPEKITNPQNVEAFLLILCTKVSRRRILLSLSCASIHFTPSASDPTEKLSRLIEVGYKKRPNLKRDNGTALSTSFLNLLQVHAKEPALINKKLAMYSTISSGSKSNKFFLDEF